MDNINGHTETATLFKGRIQNALDKLKAFCSSHSSFNTDEEIDISFESFLIPVPQSSDSNEPLSSSEYFTIVEEILEVLHDLTEELNAQEVEDKLEETSQVDSSNRLYASLKRHPE